MDFDRAMEILLKLEGGYSDDAKDPGGKTRYGVTESVAREHGYLGDMRQLPLDQAKSIYKTQYWDYCRCDALPWPLALFVFDAAVNQGAGAAIRMLQKALDTVQDGILGQQTLALAKRSTPWHWSRYMAIRAMRYQSTRNYDRFGAGWLTRLFEVAREA